MKKVKIILLLIISVIAVLVRLYGLNSPIADWHSWRQSDTAAVARNFLRFGIDPTHPRYDDLSNIQSGKDNPMGWRMVEFPLYQVVGVVVYKIFPFLTLEASLRLVSIVSTAGSVFLLGIILFDLVGPMAALLGAFLYAILPFSIYYGRTILPDAFATFWALLSLVLLLKSERRPLWYIWIGASGIAASMSVLVRPMAIFLLFPSFYVLLRNFSVKRTTMSVLLYGMILCIPLFLWRRWIVQYPEGIAVSGWLFNKGNIRFKGAWFHWLFARRLAELILGYWGLIPFGLGLVVQLRKKERIFSLLWLLGGLAYFIVFAAGNVQHDYYQALIIPIIIWFTALGLHALLRRTEGFNRFAGGMLALTSIVFMWAFSWFTMRTYFWINRPEIVEAGKIADSLLPKEAKVIAPYNGDTSFLYQTKRQGWPIGFDIDKKIQMGATHYVTVSPTGNDFETKFLAEKYTVLVRNEKFAIIDLTKFK